MDKKSMRDRGKKLTQYRKSKVRSAKVPPRSAKDYSTASECKANACSNLFSQSSSTNWTAWIKGTVRRVEKMQLASNIQLCNYKLHVMIDSTVPPTGGFWQMPTNITGNS
ncbi:unnamed protein product [Dovyalis caffra]|uniref:Uncharacterized protein n=1 Tax=Dovyalis caffra TaxID=77055 RepID=A0AAV1SFZ8_9ROSI|nr:unnamed protein product [Dovyalis caffra]